jgi:Lar family restriction alleviation protein
MELLPCPFCGSAAIEDTSKHDDGSTQYLIDCTYCNASYVSFTSMKRAVQGWNNRVKQIPEEEINE